MNRIVSRPIGVIALTIGISSGFAAPANANPANCTANGPFTAGTFRACSVDAGLTAVHVVVVGAPGGAFDIDSPGGKGAVVTGDLSVSPGGSLLVVHVGGVGADSGVSGGDNGGGAGGTNGAVHGAAGGGASDIRSANDGLSDRLVVAGGGGGGGFSNQTPASFAGGHADGGNGGFIVGGTSAAGPTAGLGGGTDACVGAAGGDNTVGVGGNGFGSGGGGGGGYAGGGGGGEAESQGACSDANAGGGGGGSSLMLQLSNGTKAIDTTGIPMVTITAPIPATSGVPTVAGSTVVGQTLTESHAPWSNSPTTIAVQWMRCDTGGSNCLVVGTAPTYALTADDAGHTIKVQETATNLYGPSTVAGASGTATSTLTSVVTTGVNPPTVVASSPACQQLDASVTNNSTTGSAVQYTVTATSGTTSVSRMTGGTTQIGQTSSVHIGDLPTGGTYTVTAKGDDGSVSATPVTVKVAECVVNDFKAKIGKGHFKRSDASVKLINRGSTIAVAVTVVSVHHSSHHYDLKPNEVRTVEAFVAPHGHSKIKVVDKTGVAAKRRFFRQ